MVFFLHTSIFTNSKGILFDNKFVKLFQTPAWAGVWMFFILSGYLTGKSFCDKRYSYTFEGLCMFYKVKFKKIIIPTFSFIFICCVLVYPSFIKNNPMFLIKILTFTYNGGPGVDGIGATWYIFTLVQLYFIAPLLCFICEKLSKNIWWLGSSLILIIIMGLGYRLFCYRYGIDWYQFVYTPVYANFDLFFGGILCSFVSKKVFFTCKSEIKKISLVILFCFIFINILTYGMFFVYQYIYPSVYLLCLIFVFLSYSDEMLPYKNNNWFEFIINKFAGLSFEFYLFHSLILYVILPAFDVGNIYILHFKLLLIGGFLTLICSYGFHRIFLLPTRNLD